MSTNQKGGGWKSQELSGEFCERRDKSKKKKTGKSKKLDTGIESI